MRCLRAALLLSVSVPALALAQTSPNFLSGDVLSAAALNAAIAGKANFPGPAIRAQDYNAADGSTCTWDASHDVGPCINNAITAAHALGGRTVYILAGTFGVSTPIVQPYSYVRLQGAGIGSARDSGDNTHFLSATRLLWIGAPGATLYTEQPPLTAASSLYSADTTGIVFDCADTAAICAQFAAVTGSKIDIGVSEPQSIGAYFTTLDHAVFTDGPGTQGNDIWVTSRSTLATHSPTGILFDSNAPGSRFNTSYNRIHSLYAWVGQGDGIVFANSDNNIIDEVGGFLQPGLVSNGRPVVFASYPYTMPNGMTVNGSAYDSVLRHAGVPVDIQGFVSSSSIATGVHVGSAAIATVTTTNTGQTNPRGTNLTVAATTGVVPGLAMNCGGNGVLSGATVFNAFGTTVQMAQGAAYAVPIGTVCTYSFGVTIQAVTGSYTLTAVDGTHWSITAPAGGHSQSNIALVSGAVSFTDMVVPISGTPTAGDTFTVSVGFPATDITVTTDGGNAVPTPLVEPGANAFTSSTRAPMPVPYGGSGDIILSGNGKHLAVQLGGFGNTATGQFSVGLGGLNNLAPGFGATTVGGNGNFVSGVYAAAGGNANVADASYDRTFGSNGTSRGRELADCWGGGKFSVVGDAQTCTQILRQTTASTAAVRLTDDTLAAGSYNCVNIPNNTAYTIRIDVVALDHTSPAVNMTWPSWSGLLTRGANAASTALTMATTPTPISNGTVAGTAIGATADTTNGCLNVAFTPPTANSHTWNAVARVQSVEVQ